jgi:pyruvate formate lyase activating enzyme
MAELFYPLLSIARLRMGTDGSGVTTLVAGAGCPLHCRWCINKKLLREAAATAVTASELLERIRIDDLYFRATGGGVTFGGGEALLHAGFIRLFREISPSDWKICVETSLAVSEESLRVALDAADHFIVDCKDMDEEIYRRYTGGDFSVMERNLRFLLQEAGPERILVRVPRIPGYNTGEDQQRSAEKLREMGVTKLELFEYVIR